MKVILKENIEKLGFKVEIVDVKNGFARNFLIPQKKALRANKENKDETNGRQKMTDALQYFNSFKALFQKKQLDNYVKEAKGRLNVIPEDQRSESLKNLLNTSNIT